MCRMQLVTHWLSAHADKRKFTILSFTNYTTFLPVRKDWVEKRAENCYDTAKGCERNGLFQLYALPPGLWR